MIHPHGGGFSPTIAYQGFPSISTAYFRAGIMANMTTQVSHATFTTAGTVLSKEFRNPIPIFRFNDGTDSRLSITSLVTVPTILLKTLPVAKSQYTTR